ncbi:MAG: TolC family protein [Spirochaetaceae bacterium]|jgi:outer membrane protein TolC|nr:TolC family protein [Spirochaetaceae bacterium]
MKKKLYGFFYIACVLAGPVLVAQQEAPGPADSQEAAGASGAEADGLKYLQITPDTAVELAIAHNLSLQQAQINNEAKRRAAQTPWNVVIPTVEIGATLGRLNEAPQSQTLPLPPPFGPIEIGGGGSQWRLSASFQATLNLNIGTFIGMKQTVEEYQAGLITVEKAKLQLERDVRKACYSMLLAKEQIVLLRESYSNADRRAAMAQANYRAGLIPEVSLLQAQVARENMRPQIDEAENNYKMAMASFALYLGLPYDTQFEITGISETVEFITLNAADLIARAAANKPDIEELRRKLSALKAQKKASFFNLYTPTLSLGFTMDPSFGGDPWKDSWTNSSLWSQQSGMFRVTLGWRLNGLLPFTVEHQGYQALNDAVKTMEAGIAQAIQGTEVEVYNSILQLEKTRTTAEAQRLTLELAERTLRLSETAYRNGLKEFLDVQNDELALRQARLGTLQQNYNYRMGLLDLEYAIGLPFGALSGRNK